ncbi:hypothetical protein BO70DRAFT_426996 [Aspergillus heteromorphus CBS 117.55]|uniref:Integral membrane protein n=1 Tax=Aspergillus heteromorphus CBS 117.55 TaxID=1448321 RepID=A0A317WV49_9EURO|nr:uncharacterized protein BO70DRAFT_426996 [Aspergillus heteromorphus CBS 117.55]PWY88150.1 hypothetical protein BO70DRAFT_426996 [Aspergillus heteromorphus CBS 117.55]
MIGGEMSRPLIDADGDSSGFVADTRRRTCRSFSDAAKPPQAQSNSSGHVHPMTCLGPTLPPRQNVKGLEFSGGPEEVSRSRGLYIDLHVLSRYIRINDFVMGGGKVKGTPVHLPSKRKPSMGSRPVHFTLDQILRPLVRRPDAQDPESSTLEQPAPAKSLSRMKSNADKGPVLLAVMWSLTGFAALRVATRLYIRARIVSNLGLDDWWIPVSMVCNSHSVWIFFHVTLYRFVPSWLSRNSALLSFCEALSSASGLSARSHHNAAWVFSYRSLRSAKHKTTRSTVRGAFEPPGIITCTTSGSLEAKDFDDKTILTKQPRSTTGKAQLDATINAFITTLLPRAVKPTSAVTGE